MSAPRSTRRFLRHFSIVVLLAVLVVGVAGLSAMWLSTSRSQAITDSLDPAIGGNRAALQALTKAQSDGRGQLLVLLAAHRSSGPAGAIDRVQGVIELKGLAHDASAQLATALATVARAEPQDHHLRAAVAAEGAAGEAWLAAAGNVAQAVVSDQPARAEELQAQADVAFQGFVTANTTVSRRLSTARQGLQADSGRLRNVAELTLAGLVLIVLTVLAFVGALASRVLVAPMVELTSVVERLRRGEQDARAPTDHGSAEVRSVAVQVNALADEVESWRSVQAETERLRRTFSEISRTVREELDMEAVFDVPSQVGPALGADRCWLRLARGGRVEEVVRQWCRDGLEPLAEIPLVGADPYDAAVHLWSREEAMSRPDLAARIDLEPSDLQLFVATTGVRSILVVPIGAGETVLGLLTWAMTDDSRAWTIAEVAAAQRVAADLGRAIVHASLYEQQLEMVGKLRDLDRRKDDFLSTVSHELRTPLTSIIGYLELVMDGTAGELPEPMRKMLDVVDRNAVRLRALIEDLLVLARIEDGSLHASSDRVGFAQLVEHAAEAVRPQAEAGGVRLSVNAGPSTLKVIGDARHLDMVALNIISNAVKFTPSGGRVSVVVRFDAETHEVLLTCADSGIGIPESDQAGMFGRFFRASNATLHAIPGTGLGLSVIKGIVDAHGGAVALTSREGKGTIVTVRLPGATLEPAPAPEPEPAPAPEPAGDAGGNVESVRAVP